MARVNKVQIDEAIANFQYEGMLIDERPYGNGHINDTFLLTFEIAEMGKIKVILQRMNKEVFTDPVALMENIIGERRSLKTAEIRTERHLMLFRP